METSLQLTDWILKNSKNLKIKVYKYAWIDKWMPGFFDYGIEISLFNKKYFGRGIDRDEKIAFEKASAEALERAVVNMEKLEMPWGTAAYPSFDGACEKAYYELLGIDRALCHHFCHKKFAGCQLSGTNNFRSSNVLKNIIEKNNIVLRLYELTPSLDAKSVCAIAWSRSSKKLQGFVAGFGVDKSIETAKLHALFECIRTVVVCFFKDYKPKEPIEILKERGEPRWHFWMAQRVEALSYLQNHLIPKFDEKVILEPENISVQDVKFTELTALKKVFPDIPITFVQAYSDKLLVPKFGEFIGDEHTMKRLEIFNGAPVFVDKTVPHFYG
jgi:hypothetical protein